MGCFDVVAMQVARLGWVGRQAVPNFGAESEGSRSSSGDLCELLLHEASCE